MLHHSVVHGGGNTPAWAHQTAEGYRSWAESQHIFGPHGSTMVPTGSTGYFDTSGNYWINFHNGAGAQLAINSNGNVTDVLLQRPYC
jgi:hypothetical protein